MVKARRFTENFAVKFEPGTRPALDERARLGTPHDLIRLAVTMFIAFTPTDAELQRADEPAVEREAEDWSGEVPF
jgi:hypothetical protein